MTVAVAVSVPHGSKRASFGLLKVVGLFHVKLAEQARASQMPPVGVGRLARQALTAVERSDPDGQATCTVGYVTYALTFRVGALASF